MAKVILLSSSAGFGLSSSEEILSLAVCGIMLPSSGWPQLLVTERFWDILPQIYLECRIFSKFLLGEKQLSHKTHALDFLGGKKKVYQENFSFCHTILFECLLG